MRRVGPPVRPQMSDKWLARTDFCGVVTEKSTTIFLNKRDFGLQTLVGDFPERKYGQRRTFNSIQVTPLSLPLPLPP